MLVLIYVTNEGGHPVKLNTTFWNRKNVFQYKQMRIEAGNYALETIG